MIRKINTMFLALTIFFALGLTVAFVRQAQAYDTYSGPCPNEIGNTPCDFSSTSGMPTVAVWDADSSPSCHLGNPFYEEVLGVRLSGPYYRCCQYDGRIKYCYGPDDGGTDTIGNVEFFREESSGRSSCTGNGQCLAA